MRETHRTPGNNQEQQQEVSVAEGGSNRSAPAAGKSTEPSAQVIHLDLVTRSSLSHLQPITLSHTQKSINVNIFFYYYYFYFNI